MADLTSKSDATAPAALGLVHGGPLSDFVKDVAATLHLGNRQTAGGIASDYLRLGAPPTSDATANAILSALLQYLLDGRRYVDAATLLWTPTLFTGEPRAVRMLWDAVFQNVFVMVPGAAAMGKSYSLGVWSYLDWRRDPEFTNIQVVGPSEKHLEKHLFSHLVKLHRSASIPAPGEVRQLEITTDGHQKDSGIFGVVVPIGKKASGRLQGIHLVRRPTPHPQFGQLARVRIFLEEAENIPVGIWEDVTNVMSNARGVEQFKIFAPFNPKDPSSQCAIRCEPESGWNSVDIETSETWKSKRGCYVVRLDAYKSENVIEGTDRFLGLQTKEGLATTIRSAGGVGTPGYYTMARGWFPPQGVDLAIISQHLVNDLYGEFQFVDDPVPVGALDVALEGGDNAVFILGKSGKANGWLRAAADGRKELVQFKDDAGRPIRRDVLQVEQIFLLPKGDTTRLVVETRRVCDGAAVRGANLAIDRAGNGAGVHDMLISLMKSGSPHGINAGSSPTERRILEEDVLLPSDEYQDLLSEMWFAARKYIEYGFVKFSPAVPQTPVVSELTGRRFLLSTRKTKVESKAAYKSRGNPSPDRADALTYLIHVVRMNSGGPPSATRETRGREDHRPLPHFVGCTDRPDYL